MSHRDQQRLITWEHDGPVIAFPKDHPYAVNFTEPTLREMFPGMKVVITDNKVRSTPGADGLEDLL